MALPRLHCSLITPEAKVFEDDVVVVSLPAHDGEIGLLYNRAPLVCELGAGLLKIRAGDKEQIWFVDAGFAQVLDNRVTKLTQRAVAPDKIDREEALHALEEARLLPTNDDAALKRRARAESSARARLHLAG